MPLRRAGPLPGFDVEEDVHSTEASISKRPRSPSPVRGASVAAAPVEDDDDDEHNCAICLGDVENRAAVAPVDHVRTHVRSDTDFQSHYLLPLASATADRHFGALDAASVDYGRPLPLPSSSANRRRNARRPVHWGRRDRPDLREEDELALAIERRKWVYRNKLFCKHIASNAFTRFRPFTPKQFSASKEMQSKLVAFCRRELQVFQGADVEWLCTYLTRIVSEFELRSTSVTLLIADFLTLEHAEHFAHELNTWLRSPYTDLAKFDRIVQYDRPVPSVQAWVPAPTNGAPIAGPSTARAPPRPPSPYREDKRRRPSDAPPYERQRRSSESHRDRRYSSERPLPPRHVSDSHRRPPSPPVSLPPRPRSPPARRRRSDAPLEPPRRGPRSPSYERREPQSPPYERRGPRSPSYERRRGPRSPSYERRRPSVSPVPRGRTPSPVNAAAARSPSPRPSERRRSPSVGSDSDSDVISLGRASPPPPQEVGLRIAGLASRRRQPDMVTTIDVPPPAPIEPTLSPATAASASLSNLAIVSTAVTNQRALLQQRLEQERVAQRARKQVETRAKLETKLERERLDGNATASATAPRTDRDRLMARLASEKREGDRLSELREQIRLAKRETELADLRRRLERAKQAIGGDGEGTATANEQRAATLRAKLDSSKREQQMASLRERLTARRVQPAGA